MLKISPLSTIGLATIIVLVLLLWGKSCKIQNLENKLAKCQQDQKPIHDTIYKTDTFSFVEHAPIPYKIESANVKVKWHFDTLYVEGETVHDTLTVDTLAGRYYATNYYKKSFTNKYGRFTASDTVSRNKSLGFSVNADSLNTAIIYNTIYKTEKPKDRTQLFLGIEAFGNGNELINAAGFNAFLKLKSNVGFESGVYFNSQNQQFYKAGFKFLIRLKKP